MKKGRLFIVSGFSGAGKGTLMEKYINEHKDAVLSVSDTSRSPRPGEKNGVHYNFVSKDEFEDNIKNGRLIEYTMYQDNYYGTPKEFVTENLEKGNNVFLEIEVDGCGKVKKIFPDAVTVFVTAPSAYELKKRLETRGTESKEKIMKRLARAAEEMSFVDQYDHLLINDDLDKSADSLYNIIKGEYEGIPDRKTFMKIFEKDLKGVLKEEELI